MITLTDIIEHLIYDVMPAARDYETAENQLSEAFERTKDIAKCPAAVHEAKRRAFEVAVAIDGLTDRAHLRLELYKNQIRRQVTALCEINGVKRDRCLDRVRAVANAYKHFRVDDQSLRIASIKDIRAEGLGYGLEGYGVGKFSGVEVLVRERGGVHWKFLGDVPWSIAGWFRFLRGRGATFPADHYDTCGLQVDP
jgi:hypothetical protein